MRKLYDPDGSIDANTLVDLNSGDANRGICALPYLRRRDGATVWFPINLIGNLYVSNDMAAGNTEMEARSQALLEILEGCEWLRHFEQINPARRLVYRCIETLIELGGGDAHRAALGHLYGSSTLATAEAMLQKQQRCFGIEAPGLALKGCNLHQALLAAYAKLSH